MNLFPNLRSSVLAIGLVVVAVPAVAEEAEIHIGRSTAGQIKVEVHFDPPLELEPSVFPGILGFATGLLGMHSADAADPINDFFQVSSAADFRFILLAKDQGMEIWKYPAGHMAIGETYVLGQAPFDNHPLWHLTTNTPGVAYSLTLKMHDVNGVYADSDPFALSFTAQIVRPYLRIARTDAQRATLSWPTNAVGWTLESANFPTAGNWNLITNVPSISSTNFSLSLGTADSPKFFRLHQP